MGLPIERWARQATLLDPPPKQVLEDITDLAHFERQFWHRQQRELRGSDTPQMLESLLGGLLATPPVVAISTASINGEVGLWSAATYTPINANTLISPESFRIAVSGRVTTSTSPANATFTPRIGTSTSGASLGASNAIAMTASITNAEWRILGDITVRSIGSGTTASAIGFFNLTAKFATAGAGAADQNIVFGHTVGTFDSTAAQGLFMGMTQTVTTVTWNTQQIHWVSWN